MAPPSPHRAPLNRAAVLARAVDFADRHGIEALSMRRLSEELGVVPMALYKHVTNKEDLLNGMVDTVLSTLDATPTDESAGWKQSVRQRVLLARHTVLAHPWLRRALETRTVRTPTVLAHMEALTSLLLRGGLTADLTHHAMHALGNRIWGFSPELFDESGPAPTAHLSSTPQPDPADYPGIMAVAADARARRPGATGCDEDFEFNFALDLILDGIERLQRRGWASST